MQEAFGRGIYEVNIKVEFNENLAKNDSLSYDGQDRNRFLDMIRFFTEGPTIRSL